jgi:hypothetical protein
MLLGLTRHFDYLFYADLEASTADPRTQNALRNLKVHFLFTIVQPCQVLVADVALFAGVCNLFTGPGKLSYRYERTIESDYYFRSVASE